MEAEQSYMTDLICDLALEIIYLQTGEKHAAVKMASIEGLLRGVYPMLAGGSMCLAPITKPPSHSRFPESNNLKILEVTKKITELLAGEVSSARNYGSVCSSMEKRKNVEKYRPLDPIMEDQLPIKSLDGSRERSSPERRPLALNSQDTTQENQEMTHQVQVNVEMKVKEEAVEELEEPYVRDDYQCAEDEISFENSVGPTEEGYSTPLHDQEEILLNIKEEKEPYVSGGEHLEEEEMSPRISTDWWHARGAQEKPHDIQLMNEIVHNLERSSLPAQRSARPEEKPYLCLECGKRFVSKFRLTQHRKTHMGEKLYYCSVCGKYFVNKTNLKEHTNIHTGERPYVCSYCGRCFSWKAGLTRHERVHTGEKPYSCLECGRSFSQKSHLTDHERTHTGEKVHKCSECGKSFAKKSNLNTHRKTHAVKRPYSL